MMRNEKEKKAFPVSEDIGRMKAKVEDTAKSRWIRRSAKRITKVIGTVPEGLKVFVYVVANKKRDMWIVFANSEEEVKKESGKKIACIEKISEGEAEFLLEEGIAELVNI